MPGQVVCNSRDQSSEHFICFVIKILDGGFYGMVWNLYPPTSDSNINPIEPLILFYFDLSSFNFLNHWKTLFSRIRFWKINTIFLFGLGFLKKPTFTCRIHNCTMSTFIWVSTIKDDVIAENYQFWGGKTTFVFHFYKGN